MIVSMTVGGRAYYLAETLKTWEAVRGIEHAEVIFNIEHDAMDACVDLCGHARAGHRYLWENTPRAGVLKAPWLAMERAFATGQEFAVVAEEDVTVSEDILEYFAWARDEFRDDPDIRIICAFNGMRPQGGEYEVLRTGAFSPLIWGTWAGTWQSEMRDRWDFDYTYRGWDYRICDLLKAEHKRIIQPAQSRSQHIGEHQGAHCTVEMFPDTISLSFEQHRPPGRYAEQIPPHLRSFA